MVKDVEHFEAHVKRGALCDLRVLLHSKVGIHSARSAERILLRAAGDSAYLVSATEIAGEGCTVEVVVIPRMWIELVEGRDLIGIIKPNVRQCEITAALQAQRYACVEPGDAGDVPACCQPVRSEEACERKLPVV